MTETSAAWIILGAALSLTLAFAACVVVQLRALSKPIEAGLGQAFRDFAPQWQRAFEAERLARMKNGRGVIGIQRKKPAYLSVAADGRSRRQKQYPQQRPFD